MSGLNTWLQSALLACFDIVCMLELCMSVFNTFWNVYDFISKSKPMNERGAYLLVFSSKIACTLYSLRLPGSLECKLVAAMDNVSFCLVPLVVLELQGRDGMKSRKHDAGKGEKSLKKKKKKAWNNLIVNISIPTLGWSILGANSQCFWCSAGTGG